MMTILLLVHGVFTPTVCAFIARTWRWAAIGTFALMCISWCLFYIAAEIEEPYGLDENDLPLEQSVRDFNRSLCLLLEPLVQQTPKFALDNTALATQRLL